jgi:hypothetical protein
LRVGGSFGAVDVDYRSVDGTALAPGDYTSVAATLHFLDGEIRKSVNVTIMDDADYEGDESFTLTIRNPSGGATLGSTTSTDVVIIDNDPPPSAGVLQLSGGQYIVTEGAASARVTVLRTGGDFGAVAIDYATSDDSAVAGEDYQPASGTLNLADGETSKTIDISLLDDAAYEVTERFGIGLSNPQGGVGLGNPAVAQIIIEDNDPAPSAGALEFSHAAYSVTEAGVAASITVVRTGGTAGEIGVDYSSSDGTATSGADYTAAAGALTFADGETIMSFSVGVVDDAIVESDETVTLSLSNPSGGGGLGAMRQATLTIVDDDLSYRGTFHFETATGEVTEGDDLSITIRRSNGTDGNVAVELVSADGSATAGSDFNAVSMLVEFADGQASRSITFSTIDNTERENSESLTLTLRNAAGGATIGAPSVMTVTITDNDRAVVTTPPRPNRGGGSVAPWWLLVLVFLLRLCAETCRQDHVAGATSRRN